MYLPWYIRTGALITTFSAVPVPVRSCCSWGSPGNAAEDSPMIGWDGPVFAVLSRLWSILARRHESTAILWSDSALELTSSWQSCKTYEDSILTSWFLWAKLRHSDDIPLPVPVSTCISTPDNIHNLLSILTNDNQSLPLHSVLSSRQHYSSLLFHHRPASSFGHGGGWILVPGQDRVMPTALFTPKQYKLDGLCHNPSQCTARSIHQKCQNHDELNKK